MATNTVSPAAPAFGRVSFVRTALVLMRLAWARTGSPLLIIGVLAVLALPVLFSLVFASRGALSGDPVDFLLARFDTIVSGLATPLIALLLGTSAFSAETDDGTLLYIVTTTTPRWWIVLSRLLFAALLTGLLAAVSVFASGFVAVGLSDPEGIVTAYSVAVFYGGVTYASLFTLLALLTRRSLVVGLIYVLLWEGALSETFQAIQYLSVRKWMTAIAEPMMQGGGDGVGPSALYALVGAAVVVTITVYLGGRRLHEPRMGRIGS
jgi:ABC-2 type transport system permease protein